MPPKTLPIETPIIQVRRASSNTAQQCLYTLLFERQGRNSTFKFLQNPKAVHLWTIFDNGKRKNCKLRLSRFLLFCFYQNLELLLFFIGRRHVLCCFRWSFPFCSSILEFVTAENLNSFRAEPLWLLSFCCFGCFGCCGCAWLSVRQWRCPSFFHVTVLFWRWARGLRSFKSVGRVTQYH